MQERRTVSPLNATPVERHLGLVAVVAIPVVLVDQLVKAWALRALSGGPVEILGPLRLSLGFNTGAAFGLGGRLVPVLAVVAVGVVIAVVIRGAAAGRPKVAVSLGLLVGGAFGNIADRLFRPPGSLRGAVVDYIDIGPWPVFNLADCAITVGCVALVLLSGRQGKGQLQRESADEGSGPT